MAHIPLLDELAVVALLAVAVTVVLGRLELPTVAGLLVAGALAGPYGTGLVTSVGAIEVLAEVGVVLLLFTIGLEFSLARLRAVFGQVAVGGVLQVGLTFAPVFGLALFAGASSGQAALYGGVFALSSTAIVLRALAERRELDAPHGRFIVGALLFQDLCVVPMVLVVPLLGDGGGGADGGSFAAALATAAAVLGGLALFARYGAGRLLAWVADTRSREIFLLAILGLCIGTAWLTAQVGLSLALGAFLAGVVVADTEHGHRAMNEVLPLRDAFVSLFFVSLGMLFDVRVVASQPGAVALLFVGFVGLKGLAATAAALAMGFPARVAWLAGVGLAQFGEFGFVLTRLAEAHGVLDAEATRPLWAAGILSMFVTPLLVRLAPHITAGERLLAPLERKLGVRGIDAAAPSEVPPSGHVLVLGFGPAGRHVARAMHAQGTRCVAMDLNVENVRQGHAHGLDVYYGDASSEEALHHAHAANARLIVVLLGNPQATARAVDTLRRAAPGVPLLARTRYASDVPPLEALGAAEVVSEEVEGAAEVVARAVRHLGGDLEAVAAAVAGVRAGRGSGRP